MVTPVPSCTSYSFVVFEEKGSRHREGGQSLLAVTVRPSSLAPAGK